MIDTRLTEAEQQAIALVRAHIVQDLDGWEALRDVDDLPGVAYALAEIAGLLAGMLTAQPGDDALDPDRVDHLLTLVSAAMARNHAGAA